MKPTPPPPPPRWLWFATVASLALLASLTIAAGRDPPPGSQAFAEPTRSTSAAELSPAFDRRCLLCLQPLY